MPSFTEDHVKRVFDRAGYGVMQVDGDRGGIVQGDGLRVVVAPFVEAAARRFGADDATVGDIVERARESRPLKFDLYGGSVVADMEGVYLPHDLIAFMKNECESTYYQAQREVNAIFAAEDPPDAEWDDRRGAYVGVVDEFAAETPTEGERAFIRVMRIADQSYNPYESGEEVYDARDAADIVAGRLSHGAIEVEVHWIKPDGYDDASVPVYGAPFDPDSCDPTDFPVGKADIVYRDSSLLWDRDDTGAATLAMAAEIVSDEGADGIAAVLNARSAELAGPAPEADADDAPRGPGM